MKEEKQAKCPSCGSDQLRFKGYRKSEVTNECISKRYICLNSECDKEGFSISIEKEQEKDYNGSYKYDERKEGATVESNNFTSKAGNKVKVLDEFLELCQVDLEVWYVDRYQLNAWDVTISGKGSSTKEDNTYTNYQIKVWLKRIVDVFDKDKFIGELIEDVKNNHAPIISLRNNFDNSKTSKDNLFIPNLYDVHLGRLCWHEESGSNYDVKIAVDLVESLLKGLFRHVSDLSKIDRIVFPIGNDFLNYDYAEPYPMTTNQTPQESDVRWQKMFRLGRNLLYSMIDWMYENVAPVDVIGIPGNHEEQSMWYLVSVLEAKYENNDNVRVDNSPKSRKYYKYGSNLIGFAHGKDEKNTELHNLMSLDAPKYWADTTYRYYYLGHNHHEKSMRSKTSKSVINQEADYKGVMISYLPAVAQTDKYEHKKGYEGSIRGARAMVHNFHKGRTHIIGENV